jgi:hypothetical protein
VAVPTTSPEVLAAHDITTIIKASSDPNDSFKFPLTVIRSYERTFCAGLFSLIFKTA